MRMFFFASVVILFVSNFALGQEDKTEYRRKYDAAIDKLEAKYPDCFDEKSQFFKAYNPRFDDAIKSKDPTTKDPEWAFHLAEVVAHQLAAKGIPVVVEELPNGEEAIRNAAAKNATEFESAHIVAEKIDQKTAPSPGDSQRVLPEQAANEKLEAIIKELAAQNALLREAANRPVEKAPESPKAYVPPPQRPAIDIARAQTLARSSRNPEAQRVGRAMLQEAANQRRIADAVRSGSISSEEAGREWHRIDMENQLDDMQDQQERDLQRLNDEVSELRREQENRNTIPTQPYNRR